MCVFQDKMKSAALFFQGRKELIGLDLHWKELGENVANWKLAKQSEQMH